jgi:hypothetical protein
MSKHPHKPDVLLADPGGIPALMPQARRLLELRQILADSLPHALARSCTVANYKRGKLIVFAENNAVAAKLRLLTPTLCDRLSGRGIEVTGMEIEVQAPEQAREKRSKSSLLSDTAVQYLVRFASQLPESPLKSCLERIATRSVGKR